MMKLGDRASAHPDVISTTLKTGESVLLHIGTKTYFSLNETGSRIWNLMSDGLTLGEISQRLESEFDVSMERAQESVVALAQELVKEQLVHVSKE